jgi:hypothetical protein
MIHKITLCNVNCAPEVLNINEAAAMLTARPAVLSHKRMDKPKVLRPADL